MASKKKIKKAIESLEKQIKKHEEKVKSYKGKNYALIGYWQKEIEERKRQKQKKEEKLNREK